MRLILPMWSLTRERWMPPEPRAVKVQPMEYLHDPCLRRPLQIAPQERLRGGDDTDLRFRCAGTIPQLQLQWEQGAATVSHLIGYLAANAPRCGWWFS